MAALKHKQFYLVGQTRYCMPKVSNRSINNVQILLKFAIKTTKKIFLLLTLNIFHTSFGGSKYLGSYLFKFFPVILYSQYLIRCIMYYLLRYYNELELVGLFLKKVVLEFLVKILDKYTYKEFL